MDIEASIKKLMTRAIEEHVFPGAVVGYIKEDSLNILPFGHLTYESNAKQVTKETVYDVASVTKVIPTSSIILVLIEKGLLHADDQVVSFIPELAMVDADKILIKHLLTFTAVFNLPQRLSSYAPEGKSAILHRIFTTPLKYPPGQEYFYSNIPYLLLGIVAERILKKPLDQIADEMFFKPLHMNNTTFHPKTLPSAHIAPTEINERGEVTGEVHDEAAWAFYQEDQIVGHAGLFSTAQDLLTFGQMILADGSYDGHQYFAPSTIKTMETEIVNNGAVGMSLGWEMSRPDYMSPHVAHHVIGKDGFTGTLILIEPHKKSCLVMLSNRTYPQRSQISSDETKKVRRQLAEIVLTLDVEQP